MSQEKVVNHWSNLDSIKSYCNSSKYQSISTKTAHRRKVVCLEWSGDGKYLASGSQDSTTNIYRVDTQKSFTVNLII